jgi:hypothetical protein
MASIGVIPVHVAGVELSVGERTVPFEAIVRHRTLAQYSEQIFVLTSKAVPTKEEMEKVPYHQVCIAVRSNGGEIYRIRGKPVLDFLNAVRGDSPQAPANAAKK